jgi:hypothetical protein
VDPGPAFQWDYVIENARQLMGRGAGHDAARGHARMRTALGLP